MLNSYANLFYLAFFKEMVEGNNLLPAFLQSDLPAGKVFIKQEFSLFFDARRCFFMIFR